MSFVYLLPASGAPVCVCVCKSLGSSASLGGLVESCHGAIEVCVCVCDLARRMVQRRLPHEINTMSLGWCIGPLKAVAAVAAAAALVVYSAPCGTEDGKCIKLGDH